MKRPSDSVVAADRKPLEALEGPRALAVRIPDAQRQARAAAVSHYARAVGLDDVRLFRAVVAKYLRRRCRFAVDRDRSSRLGLESDLVGRDREAAEMLGQRGDQDHVIVRRATGALSAGFEEVQPLDRDPIARVALFVLRAPRFDLRDDRVVPLERRLGGGLAADRGYDECADRRRDREARNIKTESGVSQCHCRSIATPQTLGHRRRPVAHPTLKHKNR